MVEINDEGNDPGMRNRGACAGNGSRMWRRGRLVPIGIGASLLCVGHLPIPASQ
jgi:hypothetical protein